MPAVGGNGWRIYETYVRPSGIEGRPRLSPQGHRYPRVPGEDDLLTKVAVSRRPFNSTIGLPDERDTVTRNEGWNAESSVVSPALAFSNCPLGMACMISTR